MTELILSSLPAAAQSELAVYERFNEASMQMQAWMANVGDDAELRLGDLVQVKTPTGGSVFWTIEKPGADPVSVPKISGICVFQGFSGTLWPTRNNAAGSKPVLSVNGEYRLKTARLRTTVSRDPETRRITSIEGVEDQTMVATLRDMEIFQNGEPTGTWDWKSLPYTQFGSGRSNSGKAVKESRGLFILQPGEILPLYIRTSPAALQVLADFFRHLSVPYWQAVLEISLRKEEKDVINEQGRPERVAFSVPVVKHVSSLGVEAGSFVKNTLTKGIRELWLSGAVDSDENSGTVPQ